MSAETSPAGYDVPAVEAWIAAHDVPLTAPLTWTRLEGGHSNLTYRLADAKGRQAVIRRPPLGELLPGAHDMAREWSVISALGPTSVPTPAALGYCDDLTVTGAKFYIMGLMAGSPLYSADDTRRVVPEDRREALAFDFVDVLANLHAIDPESVGLGSLGKTDSYVGRQLRSWHRSWMASIAGAEYDDPRAHDIQQTLLESLPDQGPARIVHGDYGLHNCLSLSDGTIGAVLDWEICTLGDPLADLAYALNPWPDPSDAEPPSPLAATAAEGFPSRSTLAKRYAERTGRDLSNLDYYFAFAHWKSAAIIHGVYARYREGKKSTEGIDMDGLRLRIERLLATADEALTRHQAKAGD